MRKTMGAAMPGKKSTRFRIVLTFKGYLSIKILKILCNNASFVTLFILSGFFRFFVKNSSSI